MAPREQPADCRTLAESRPGILSPVELTRCVQRTGQVLSAIGDYLYTIAVMWIAIKLSGSDAGWVAGAQAIATFVSGLLGGVVADRWNRRIILIVVDTMRAVVVACLPNVELLSWSMMQE